jgi:hypothetical protein
MSSHWNFNDILRALSIIQQEWPTPSDDIRIVILDAFIFFLNTDQHIVFVDWTMTLISICFYYYIYLKQVVYMDIVYVKTWWFLYQNALEITFLSRVWKHTLFNLIISLINIFIDTSYSAVIKTKYLMKVTVSNHIYVD